MYAKCIIIAERFRSMLSVFSWLLAFSFKWIDRRQIAGIVALDIMSALARGSVVTVLAYFVAVLEQNVVKSSWIPVELEKSLQSLLIISVAILFFQFFASVSTYFSAVLMRKVARKTHKELAKQSLHHLHDVRLMDYKELIERPNHISQLMIRDPLQSGVALETILKLFQPFAYAVIAFAIMIYMEPEVTGVLVLFVLLFFPVIYSIISMIQRNARDFYQQHTFLMAKKITQVIQSVAYHRLTGASCVPGDFVEKSVEYKNYLNGYDGIQLSTDRVNLAIASSRSVIIFFSIFVIGWLALEEARPWSMLIAFVAALVYAGNAAQNALSLFTTLIRFHPQIQRLKVLDERYNMRVDITSTAKLPDYIEFKAEGSDLIEQSLDKGKLPLKGGVLQVISPEGLDLLEVNCLHSKLQKCSNLTIEQLKLFDVVYAMRFERAQTIEDCILGQNVSEKDREWLEDAFKHFKSAKEVKSLPDQTATMMDSAEFLSASKALVYSVFLLAAARGTCEAVMIDGAVLKAVGPEAIVNLQSVMCKKKMIVVVSKNLRQAYMQADLFIAFDKKGVIGLGEEAWASEFLNHLNYSSLKGALDMEDESLYM